MDKLPYEQIAIEANKLLDKAIHAPSLEVMKHWYEQFTIFLASAGWTAAEFQEEELRRLEPGWGPKSD
jgi:hypothetical protein